MWLPDPLPRLLAVDDHAGDVSAVAVFVPGVVQLIQDGVVGGLDAPEPSAVFLQRALFRLDAGIEHGDRDALAGQALVVKGLGGDHPRVFGVRCRRSCDLKIVDPDRPPSRVGDPETDPGVGGDEARYLQLFVARLWGARIIGRKRRVADAAVGGSLERHRVGATQVVLEIEAQGGRSGDREVDFAVDAGADALGLDLQAAGHVAEAVAVVARGDPNLAGRRIPVVDLHPGPGPGPASVAAAVSSRLIAPGVEPVGNARRASAAGTATSAAVTTVVVAVTVVVDCHFEIGIDPGDGGVLLEEGALVRRELGADRADDPEPMGHRGAGSLDRGGHRLDVGALDQDLPDRLGMEGTFRLRCRGGAGETRESQSDRQKRIEVRGS